MTFSSFGRRLAPWLLGATLGGAAAPALAQSPACEQFKDTVATRIPPEALGTLVIAAASTPVPPGAKVVGTCDGGAFKILHYRRGLTPQAANADSAAGIASAASPASAVAAAPRVAARASAPAAAASRPEPAKPVAAKLPEPVKPAAPKFPEPVASPVAMAPAVAAPVVPDTRDEPLMRDPPPQPSSDGPGLIATATDALVEHWPWTLAAVLLALGAWGWSWFSHRQSYDAAGLPRGPKL
ncbi:hypothetical protein [Rhizobacter sp. P5_C2]